VENKSFTPLKSIMPELPEVQTIVDELKKTVKNRRIVDLWTDWSKYRPIRHHVVGKKIIDIERRGKNILFSLSDNHLLLIHQKMSGHLLVGKWKWACPVRSREGSQRAPLEIPAQARAGIKDSLSLTGRASTSNGIYLIYLLLASSSIPQF